jgi:glycosyltransferase involved in cell wall biosynthesis
MPECESPTLPMVLALVAPPTATVAAADLGGLDMVRWLAEGLARRGHQVTLIGAGLEGIVPDGYAVAATGVDGRVGPGVAVAVHAEHAAEILGDRTVDLVGDHSRSAYLPTTPGQRCLVVRTAYETTKLSRGEQPHHVGLVPISRHQVRAAIRDRDSPSAWLGVIHPGIPFAEHPLNPDHHNGPTVYLGRLGDGNGVELVIGAAHEVGLPLVLAGTHPTPEARVHAAVHLEAMLGAEDALIEETSVAERWDLLSSARVLIAPLGPETAFSLSAVEAMAYGTPVVGLAGTVIDEQVLHGTSGIIAQRKQDLAQAVTAATKLDPTAVRAHAELAFDTDAMVRGYELLFRKLLEGRR